MQNTTERSSRSAEGLYKFFIYFVLVLLAVIIIVPVAWVFMASIKQNAEFYGNPWALPAGFYWQNFVNAWNGAKMGEYMLNSVIVTALALVTVTIHYARPVYQTEVTLFLAYLLMFMPRALINLRAGIAQAPVELENVARSLGSTPAKALWSVTLRLAAPGAAAGAALVFLGVSNELTATLLLSPLGTRTLSTGFWALTSEIDYVAAAPYAMLMILISLPLTAILYMQSKKIAGL